MFYKVECIITLYGNRIMVETKRVAHVGGKFTRTLETHVYQSYVYGTVLNSLATQTLDLPMPDATSSAEATVNAASDPINLMVSYNMLKVT